MLSMLLYVKDVQAELKHTAQERLVQPTAKVLTMTSLETHYFYFGDDFSNIDMTLGILDACQPGSYSPSGYEPCKLCPMHYYQDAPGEAHCTVCDSHQITLQEGSTSFAQCVDGSAYNFTIYTFYTCKILSHILSCFVISLILVSAPDLCVAGVCQNGGTCSVVQHTVRCTCIPGSTVLGLKVVTSDCTLP